MRSLAGNIFIKTCVHLMSGLGDYPSARNCKRFVFFLIQFLGDFIYIYKEVRLCLKTGSILRGVSSILHLSGDGFPLSLLAGLHLPSRFPLPGKALVFLACGKVACEYLDMVLSKPWDPNTLRYS